MDTLWFLSMSWRSKSIGTAFWRDPACQGFMDVNHKWNAFWKFRMETVFNGSWYSFLYAIVHLFRIMHPKSTALWAKRFQVPSLLQAFLPPMSPIRIIVKWIHRWLVNSHAKGQQKRKAAPYGDVIFPANPIHNDYIMHEKVIVNINGLNRVSLKIWTIIQWLMDDSIWNWIRFSPGSLRMTFHDGKY